MATKRFLALPTITAAQALAGDSFPVVSAFTGTATNYVMSLATVRTLIGMSDLLFTDALYDIGKAGLTRPRDIFLSRNLTVGGAVVPALTGAAVDGWAEDVSGLAAVGVLNGATQQFGATAFAGIVMIYNVAGTFGIFAVQCANGTCELLAGSAGAFSQTIGTANRANAYIVASRLIVQNLLGYNTSFRVRTLKFA